MKPAERLKEIEEAMEMALPHFSENSPVKADIEWLIARVKALTDTLEWIMPKVHQGNHDGEFEECPKATCVAYHEAIEK